MKYVNGLVLLQNVTIKYNGRSGKLLKVVLAWTVKNGSNKFGALRMQLSFF